MANPVLSHPRFDDEQAAYDWIEAIVWANGRVCPHCGVCERSGLLKGTSTRIGLYKCYACRKPFTVKIGTIFEDSHASLNLWLQAMCMLCSSKKGISTNQLARTLGVHIKTAWHMSHRIRLAMDEGGSDPLGGDGAVVESDETYTVYKEGGPTRILHPSTVGKSEGSAVIVFRSSHLSSAGAALGVTDEERTDRASRGIVGKRLTYRETVDAAKASD